MFVAARPFAKINAVSPGDYTCARPVHFDHDVGRHGPEQIGLLIARAGDPSRIARTDDLDPPQKPGGELTLRTERAALVAVGSTGACPTRPALAQIAPGTITRKLPGATMKKLRRRMIAESIVGNGAPDKPEENKRCE